MSDTPEPVATSGRKKGQAKGTAKKAKRKRLDRPSVKTTERLNRLRQLYAAGMSDSEIQRDLDLNYQQWWKLHADYLATALHEDNREFYVRLEARNEMVFQEAVKLMVVAKGRLNPLAGQIDDKGKPYPQWLDPPRPAAGADALRVMLESQRDRLAMAIKMGIVKEAPKAVTMSGVVAFGRLAPLERMTDEELLVEAQDRLRKLSAAFGVSEGGLLRQLSPVRVIEAEVETGQQCSPDRPVMAQDGAEVPAFLMHPMTAAAIEPVVTVIEPLVDLTSGQHS